jgi:hypothetical protein
MRKKLLALFVITTFLSSLVFKNVSAATTFPAEQFPYKNLQIQVMPEFDAPSDWPKNTPAQLVGLYGTITNKTGSDYSGKIEIPVPVNDKNFESNLVAEFPDPNKPEVQRPYDIDKQDGTISWTPGKPIKSNGTYSFVIEYYTNTIAVSDKKSFTYEFTNQASIDTLDVIFYSPMKAKNVVLDPPAQSTDKSDYGEDLYYYEYKNVKPGNNLKYTFSYTKPDNTTSMSVINTMQPPNDSTHSSVNSSKTSTDNSKPPIIGIGGASVIGISIVIAALLIFFGLRGGFRPKTSPTSSVTKSGKKQQVKPTNSKKESKLAISEEKKELRKRLLNGKIDQETYEEEMKKLI